jgi:flagellar protein FlbD
MIELSRLNGKVFHLNPELIETIDSTPDTVITLTSGKTIMVKETVKAVVEKIYEYHGTILKFRLTHNGERKLD